jgi:hypothetical protein
MCVPRSTVTVCGVSLARRRTDLLGSVSSAERSSEIDSRSRTSTARTAPTVMNWSATSTADFCTAGGVRWSPTTRPTLRPNHCAPCRCNRSACSSETGRVVKTAGRLIFAPEPTRRSVSAPGDSPQARLAELISRAKDVVQVIGRDHHHAVGPDQRGRLVGLGKPKVERLAHGRHQYDDAK